MMSKEIEEVKEKTEMVIEEYKNLMENANSFNETMEEIETADLEKEALLELLKTYRFLLNKAVKCSEIAVNLLKMLIGQ